MINLSRLNPQGVAAFSEYLSALQESPTRPPPLSLLNDPSMSIEVAKVPVAEAVFKNRLSAAQEVDRLLASSGLSQNAMDDLGLWAWLSLRWFDAVCPVSESGVRKVGEAARYIPSLDYKKFYRHLLRGPWRIFRIYSARPEEVLLVLCQPVHVPGEVVEQLASRQEIVTRQVLLKLANSLYFDVTSNSVKRGATSKEAPGSIRRFFALTQQLELTFDLDSLSTEELNALLPAEFAGWRHK